jgi:hypothetical protein
VTPAGSQVSTLAEDPAWPWRYALSTGVAGKWGGRRISSTEENQKLVLFFAGQADASYLEGRGQAARLRFRLYTGGEGGGVYAPSEGDGEFAWMIGPREFRFVLARAEYMRYPGLGLQSHLQAGTLPCFDGTLSVYGDLMQLSYFLAPVEGVWVRYYGGAHYAHRPGWTSEDDHPFAASAARVRYSLLLAPSVPLSVQGDILKSWGPSDLLAGVEGTVGYQLPRQRAGFHAGLRWTTYTRRGPAKDTHETSGEVMLVGSATLAF